MRGDFSNGPGQVAKGHMIFPKDQAVQEKEKYVFERAGPDQQNSNRAGAKILHFLSSRNGLGPLF